MGGLFTKDRILRILSTLFLIICAVIALQFITKPKIKNATKSVDKILISSGIKAANVTKEESLEAIISSINKSSLKKFPSDSDIKFDNNDINCQFLSGTKEVMYITLLNNPLARGIIGRSDTLPPPADSPKIVTFFGSPPNAEIFFFIQRKASI